MEKVVWVGTMRLVHNAPFLSSISTFRDHLKISGVASKHPIPATIHCVSRYHN